MPAASEPRSNMGKVSAWTLIWASTQPVLKVVLLCAVGAFCARKVRGGSQEPLLSPCISSCARLSAESAWLHACACLLSADVLQATPFGVGCWHHGCKLTRDHLCCTLPGHSRLQGPQGSVFTVLPCVHPSTQFHLAGIQPDAFSPAALVAAICKCVSRVRCLAFCLGHHLRSCIASGG